jgi:archaemetzincin
MNRPPQTRNHWIIGLTLLILAFAATTFFDPDSSPGQSAKKPTPSKSSRPAVPPTDFAGIRKAAAAIRPLHAKMEKPKPGDWLAHHKETGQTFDEYMRDRKKRVCDQFSTMYIQPLGKFEGRQGKMLEQTADFMNRFFGMSVKSLETYTLDTLPADARRVHPEWKDKQILSTYILDDVLKPRRPKDAVAVLGLTASDLWPGEGWNFVFGQASLTDRVGVWSMYRFGDPDKSDDDYKICLRRTLATAVHETGHMLGLKHCTAYECGMNGSNNLRESDSRPIEFCPECQQKIWFTCGVDPQMRFRKLLDFAEEHELDEEAAYWRKATDGERDSETAEEQRNKN